MRREIRPASESLFIALRKLFHGPKKIFGLGWSRVYFQKDRNFLTIFIPSEGRRVFIFRPREERKFVTFDDKSGELGKKEITNLYRRIVTSPKYLEVQKAERPKD